MTFLQHRRDPSGRSQRWRGRRTIQKLPLLLLFLLAGCIGSDGYTNRALTPYPLTVFATSFHDIRFGYIVLVQPSQLLIQALQGMRTVPAIGSQPALDSAVARAATIQGDASSPYLNLFGDAVDALNESPQAPSRAVLVKAALSGMLGGLDTHSKFYPAQEPRPGAPGGLGVEVTRVPEGLKIIRTLPGNAASRAGLLPEDVLLSIDGHDLSTDTLEAATARLTGPVGSQAVLVLRRGQAAPLSMTITRAVVRNVVLATTRLGDTTYISIGTFSTGISREVRRALRDARQAGALHGLILDLRYNTGGLLDEAVAVAGALLPPGTNIATAIGRSPADQQHFTASGGDDGPDGRVIVLTNHETASGSEIVVAALRHARRAVIMGSRTAGAGSVTTRRDFRGFGSILYTTGRVVLSSGIALDAGGIIPDVEVPRSAPPTGKEPAGGDQPVLSPAILARLRQSILPVASPVYAPNDPQHDTDVLAAQRALSRLDG